MKEIEKITKPVVKWYQKNKRDLPWRRKKDPYQIWISEIMLQQTRIEAVKSYYERFLKELPTVYDLAKVDEEKLLKLWEGLGYYNRARNLKKAAIEIQEKFQGEMPKHYEELMTLPGIGEYTAGAIASIAYDEKVPAVDGNVMRVVSRILGSKKDILEEKTKKEITQLLKEIMPKEAGDFNEGLMELGERICLPKAEPLCKQCPLKEMCVAKEKGLTQEIPVRKVKNKRRQVKITVFLLEKEGKIAILKRKNKGLLAGMYEFPNVEEKLRLKEIPKYLEKWGIQTKKVKKVATHHHVFSHLEWEMIGYKVEVEEETKTFLWAKKEEVLEKYAMPGAFKPFREKM